MPPCRRLFSAELLPTLNYRFWPYPDLLWNQRLRRLLGGKRTRYARREIFQV
jgi:hypothetical protein